MPDTGDRERPADSLLDGLVAALPDAVVGTDAEFRVTVWNAGAERLYGYTKGEALGRFARDLTTLAGDDSHAELEAALARDGRVEGELRARRRDGSMVELEVFITRVHEPPGYVGVHRDVTERRVSELDRRRMAAIVQGSSDFIGMSDLEGRPLFLNDAGRRMVGLDTADAVGAAAIPEFFVPEERERVVDEYLPSILADGRQARELTLQHFETGDRIPVSWDGFRVDDPETGEPLALATIMRDLTERRRLDTILAAVTDGIYALDAALRFAYVNDEALKVMAQMLGQAPRRSDFLGRAVFDLFPGVRDELEALYRAVLSGGPTRFEFEYEPEARCFDNSAYPLTGGGIAVYFREITEHKTAERARERHARQQAAIVALGMRASRAEDAVALMEEVVLVAGRTLDAELVAVIELLADGRSALLRAGSGWAPGAVGGVVPALLEPSGAAGEPVVAERLEDHEPWRAHPLLAAHGVASGALVPIPGRQGPFGGLGVFSRTPRRFGNEEVQFLQAIANVLQSALERAQMAQRMRDVLASERRRIARALHDETLQELSLATVAATRSEPADELLEALRRVAEQIREAVFDLRLGDYEEEPLRARLQALVARQRAIDPRHEIVVQLDEALDQLPGDVSIHLLRIAGEALTNARRHAGARRVELRVALRENTLIASVTDDGHGVASDAVHGHGIAGMRERAELLGGRLAVTERPGGGTIVELRAPVLERPQAAGRARVLLVDDHAAIREAIAMAFADDGRFVVTAQAGSLAEARQALEGIDVAIIDLVLPDGDGSGLIAELRAASPHAQALVLSANVDRRAVARAVERGAVGVLSKVTHLHEVVGAVGRVLAGETLIPLDEVVELLRFAGRERERELEERGLAGALTAREREILQLLADGLDGPTMAARLYISPRTQRNHVANILSKLGVHSQLQAVTFGLRHGIVVLR
jgi:PAS domain S-box-containing protein